MIGSPERMWKSKNKPDEQRVNPTKAEEFAWAKNSVQSRLRFTWEMQ